jgi:hypothetical protein
MVPFTVHWSRCASIACAIGIWILAAFVALTTIDPSAASAIRFLAYVLVFNLLPGIVIARLLLPRLRSPGTFLIYALAAGIAANVLIFFLLWIAGFPHLFRAFPVAAVGGLVLLRRRLRIAEILSCWVSGRTDISWAAGALLLCGTPLLTVAYLLADDPSGSSSLHYAFQGLVVRSLETGWPPLNLGVAGLKLSYHYAVHLWILAAFQNTGLELGILVARYGPLFFLGCAGAMVFAFSRFVLKLPSWTAGLPVIAVFGIVGLPPIFAGIFGSFASYGSALIMSPALGFIVFLFGLTFIIEIRRLHSGRVSFGAAVVGTLTFIGTGARGVFGPIMICALALLLMVEWRRTGALGRGILMHVVSATAGFVAALTLFFTLGWAFSGTGFVTFTGQPFTFLTERQGLLRLPLLLTARGVRGSLAGAIGFLVIAAFQAGFLTAGFFYEMVCMTRSTPSDAEILLIGAGAAGIAGTFMTQAPGHSHFSFLQYASISMSILGAQGLDRALRLAPELRTVASRRLARMTVIAASIVLLIVQLSELPSVTWNWLGHHGRAAVASMFTSTAQSELTDLHSFSCATDRSADDLMAQVPTNSVVVIVPGAAVFSRPCEYLWLFVGQPRLSVNPFTSTYTPGRLSGPLGALFAQRRDHLTASINGALHGALSASDLIAIAQTLPDDRPVFVLLARSVSVNEHAQIIRVAEKGPVMLLRVLLHFSNSLTRAVND